MLEAIATADRIVLAPSNPFVSLDPILAVDGVREAVEARRDGRRGDHADDRRRAVKGPLGGMLDTLGHERSPLGVARTWPRWRRASCSTSADAGPRRRLRALVRVAWSRR